MGRFFQDYFLNGAQFYDLFDIAAKNAVAMAELLADAVNTEAPLEREIVFKEIDRLEGIGDDTTHKIYLALDKVVFTPLNRQDIHTLASAIDDVADLINEASERMLLYNIDEMMPAIKSITDIILQASSEIEHAVNLLRSSNKGEEILESCELIKDYERQSDQIYYNSLADLFANEKNAITLIKYREILHSLESTTKKCKKTTEVIQAILLNSFKYAK